jgi:hypothetical protein
MALNHHARISLPMHLLAEPLPSFTPGEINLARKLSLIDRRAPFELLYQALIRLGYEVGNFGPRECDRHVCWTAKQVPDDAVDKAIILEVGWIPRWSYQASPSGSNAQGHYAGTYEYAELSPEDTALTRQHLEKLRRLYSQTVNWETVDRLRQRLREPFLLFAFQLANDHNLRFSGTDFSKFCSSTPAHNVVLAQACIDAVEAERPALPVVYKQHPFDPTKGFSASLRARGVVLDNEDDLSTHEIFATGLCRGVVSINSNSAHDAAVWDIPSLCLGTLVWHKDTQRPPCPRSLSEVDTLPRRKPSEAPEMLAYLFHLIRHQWVLSDFQNGLMVEALLGTRGLCEPLALRRALGLTH